MCGCSGVADLLAVGGPVGRGAGHGAGAAGGAGLLLRGVGGGLQLAAGAVRRRRLPHLQERAAGRAEDQRGTSLQVSVPSISNLYLLKVVTHS